MSRLQRFTPVTTLAWTLVLLINGVFYPQPAQAQWWWPPAWFSRSSNWGPSSGNSTAAAHRGGRCPRVEIPVTALAPLHRTEDGREFVLGATASDRPTLWFYLPYAIAGSLDKAKQQSTGNPGDKPIAELRLEEQDPQTQEFRQRVVATLPAANPGIIGVRVPDTEPSLTPGKTYHWLLVVRCDPDDSSANQFAELSLHRVSVDVSTSTASASLQQRLDFYIQNGLWAETMSLCGQLNQSSDNKAALTEWSQTLQAVPFDGIKADRIVSICRTNPQLLKP